MNWMDKLRNISPGELAGLGLQGVAYVKPMRSLDGPYFAIHAADGSFLGEALTLEDAIVGIREGNLYPVSLH